MTQAITIARRHWLPLLALNSIVLAATAYALYHVQSNFVPTWKSSAKLILPIAPGGLDANLGDFGNLKNSGTGFSKELNPLKVQSDILTSEVVLERVRRLEPQPEQAPSLSDYKSLFTVTTQSAAPIMMVETEATSPQLARQRINNLMRVYQARLDELRLSDNKSQGSEAKAELANARRKLARSQAALESFQRQTGLIDSTEQTKGLVQAITQLKTAQATAIAESNASNAQTSALANRLNATPQQAINSLRLAENKEYQIFRDGLAQVEADLAKARGVYTENSPQIQDLLDRRQELTRSLGQQSAVALPNGSTGVDTTLSSGSNNTNSNRAGLVTELVRNQTLAAAQGQRASQLQQELNKLTAELRGSAAQQSRLADLQRQYEIDQGSYKTIIAQMKQGDIANFNSYPDVQVLDSPISDSKPSSSKGWLILLGGLVGAVCGSTAVILGLESRNPLLTSKDLQRIESPMLFRLPRFKRSADDLQLATAAEEVEFQRIASAISFLRLDNHRLMVTSANSGEGKTTVTLGLAIALMKLGFRVLVVDGDLQQAEMTHRLGAAPAPMGNSLLQPISIYQGLDLLPAPAIPREHIGAFFARGTFETGLNAVQAAHAYDYVLVDTPPVNETGETTLMSASINNMLFVVRPGVSMRYSVLDSFEQLSQYKTRMVGVVVNGTETQAEPYGYRSSRYNRHQDAIEAEV